uniref:Uncharacterized protein n=1 Tax=Brassica oleracea TaxID=3712 RepID=A0A3P6G2M4_BRAOL|nr:unnamed protein product [Brassica oleracea]
MICSQQLLRLFSMSGGGGDGPQTPMNMGEDGFGFHFFDQQTLLWKSILQRLSFVCCSSGVRY